MWLSPFPTVLYQNEDNSKPKQQTFSLAKCNKQTKQIGTEMLLVIWADNLDGSWEYMARNSIDRENFSLVEVLAV